MQMANRALITRPPGRFDGFAAYDDPDPVAGSRRARSLLDELRELDASTAALLEALEPVSTSDACDPADSVRFGAGRVAVATETVEVRSLTAYAAAVAVLDTIEGIDAAELVGGLVALPAEPPGAAETGADAADLVVARAGVLVVPRVSSSVYPGARRWGR
jgi:hypothetical protein